MPKHGKRFRSSSAKIDKEKVYSKEEAIKLVKEVAQEKFDSSIEVHLKLGIDPKHASQIVRGSFVLPHGMGKSKKIAVFAEGKQADQAKEAGAQIVGGDELINQIKTKKKCDFEVALATPDMMKKIAPIAKTLGQKGLMPNPRNETITPDPAQTIKELNAGKVNFRNDDFSNVHQMIGKISFDDDKLLANLGAFLDAIKKAKPDETKGVFFRGATICSSMGPGIKIQI
ncbi:MAG: 50S ribosomal protein L1 [Patescibacteria group bacterium]